MSNCMSGFSPAATRSNATNDRWLQKTNMNNYSFYDHIPMTTTAINYSNKLINTNQSSLTSTQLSAMQNGLLIFNLFFLKLFLGVNLSLHSAAAAAAAAAISASASSTQQNTNLSTTSTTVKKYLILLKLF